MQINKKELLQKLELVKPGVANKDIIEFTNFFSFTGQELITFNDAVSVRCPLKSEIIGSVKADQFFSILSKIAPDKEGNVELSTNDSELVIKGKRVQAGVVFDAEGILPLDAIELKKEWQDLPSDFITGIKLSAFCCSNDESRPLLTCINITKKQMQSTNGVRLFNFNLDNKIEPFLLPNRFVSILTKYALEKYQISNGWAHFKTKEKIIISCRVYQEDTFPEINQFFNSSGTPFTFPKKMTEVLEKAIIFCEGDTTMDHLVSIDIKEKKCIVKSQSSSGWFKETIPNKSDVEYCFEINIHFLNDILKNTNECIINLENEQESVYFKTDKWEHAISIQSGE